MTGITAKDKYLGDSSKTDWAMDGLAVPYDDTLLLTMAPGTVGTVLATTTYMWYGTVKAKFKTSRGRGVVTAFILLSDVKDEIDYEFVGVDLETAQTNYYFQGVAKCMPLPLIDIFVLANTLQMTRAATSPFPTPLIITTSTKSSGPQTPSPGSSTAKRAA